MKLLRQLDYDERLYLDKIHKYYQMNRPQDNVIRVADCGGASGAYTDSVRIIFWDFVNRFHIFEPVPESFSFLKGKYQGLGDIEVSCKAIWKAAGIVKVGVGENPEHSQVMVVEYDGQVITAQADTLDNLFGIYDRLHLVKLDIEGEEVNAIRGAKTLISSGRIDFIQFEYGGTWIARKETLRGVGKLLPGWKIYSADVEDLANARLKQAVLDFDDYSMRNYLCVAPHVNFS